MSVRIVAGRGRQVNVFRPEDERDPEQNREWLRTAHTLLSGEKRVGRQVCINFQDQLYLEESSDYLGHSIIELVWEIAQPPTDNQGVEVTRLREEAFTRAQWVVRQYRSVADEVDVRIPGAADAPYVILAGAAEYQFGAEGVEAEFSTLNKEFRWLPVDVSGVLKEDWGPGQIEAFADRLGSDAPIPIWRELFLEAKALSKVQRSHRLAIVVTASALEAYARALIAEECELRGIKELPRRDGSMEAVSEWVEAADLRSELLGTGAHHLVGSSVKDCSEYHEWYDKAHVPRNQIIHRGRTDAKEEDAEAAFVAAVAYVNRLTQFVIQSRLT